MKNGYEIRLPYYEGIALIKTKHQHYDFSILVVKAQIFL